MTILEIDGRRIEVDDSFLSLSPEEQDNFVDEISETLAPQETPIIDVPEEGSPVTAISGAPIEEETAVDLSPLLEQGATLGFADEVSGLSRAVGQLGRNVVAGDPITQGVGRAFDRGVDEARAEVEQSLEENPIAGRVVEGVGALATGPGKLLASAGNTLLGRIVAGAAEGGVLGGLFGFGTAEGGVAERVPDALGGVALGAGVGGALPGVLKAGELASRPIRTAVGALRPDASAQARVVEAFGRDQVSPGLVAARLKRSEASGVPQAVIDVAGSSTQRLGRASRTVPGSGSEKLDAFLAARQLDQPERVLSAVRRTLGGDDVFRVADDIVEQRSALADQMYTEAFATAKPVKTTAVKNQIEKKLEKAAGGTRAALNRVAREIGEKTDAEALHNVKFQVIDPMIAAAKKAGDNAKVSALQDVKRQLLSDLKRASPEYDKAREVFSSLSDLTDALTAGQKFLNKDARLTAKELAKMTDGEKELFRLGASEAIAQKINAAPDGASIVRRIFGNPAQRAQLRAVFPDKRSFRQFQVAMTREARTSQTSQFVRGGSQTADKAADLIDAQGGAVAGDLLRGDPVGAATRAAGAAINFAQGITPKTADAIADILTSRDPAVINTIMKALESKAAASALTQEGVSAGLRAATREGVALSN